MASSIDKGSMDLRAESADGNCLVETESTPDGDLGSIRKHPERKKRILYDREFLIKCFHNPASTRKPNGFPIPHLNCTLSASKVKRLPFSTPQSTTAPAYSLKRKEEGAKRDRENEDNISLRPHSGNFSAGCGPNLTSPSHASSINSFPRIHLHEEPPKGYEREYHRNNFRYGGHRRDVNDRTRMDRDRDMERGDRDHRDRMSGSNHRNSNSWSDDNSDWSRRRSGAHFPRDRDYNVNSNKRYSNDRRDMDEQEPEWFSGGPSSQHETIELRGFLDDDRREKSDDRRNGIEKEHEAEQDGNVDSSEERTKNENTCDSPMDLIIEKILKMDHIPGILSNDLLETEEPCGSSRFSQLFKRNSSTPDPCLVRAHGEFKSYANEEDKSKAVQEMSELLRNMLIKKNAPSLDSPPDEKSKETTKLAPATKDDVDAFKKLVTPLFEKVLHGPENQKKGTSELARKSPNTELVDQQGASVLDIFKQPPMNPQEEGNRNNLLQDIFNNMMSKPNLPPMHGDNVPRLTPQQILQMIPPDLQYLVMSFNVSQWDMVQFANIAKHNEWTFRHVMDQLIMQQCPPQQHMIYVGILTLVIHGRLNLPGVIVVESPISHQMPPVSQPQQMPMPNQRAQNFEKFMQISTEEGPKEMTKRSGTLVSSMAFTPTSVLRKMTANDGNKLAPPPNAPEFVPVPGGLLPTPHTTAPVMMNSNNPNLANLISTMGRPVTMQFRPPPPQMAYPPNPGFHPAMMPPTMNGPVTMLPPSFQNIFPTQQPIYNSKADEN